MTGLYLVAAELSNQGFIACPTSRSAQAADLLVTDTHCRKTFAVQVKTNARTFNFWLVNDKTQELRSDTLVYALVNLTPKGTEYYLVPSNVVADTVIVSKETKTRNQTWYSVYRKDAVSYRDNWAIFSK